MGGMGSHQSPRMLKDEWLTPPHIIRELGPFDLDPCAPVVRPWDTARSHYNMHHDGLKQPWTGRVWLNPPYGRETGKWLAKLANHESGIALIFARTETKMFFSLVWDKAYGLLFLKGRIAFHHVSGQQAFQNSGAPSVLVAYGDHDAEKLQSCNIPGKFITLRKTRR